MKRIILSAAALLLLACTPAAPRAVTEATPAPVKETTVISAQSTVTAEPSAAPVFTDAPTLAPEPTATPEPDRFAEFFSDTPVLEERAYRSSTVGISVEERTVEETYGKRVTYYVADIHVRDVTSIKTEAAQGDFGMRYTRFVKDIASDAGAILAIDGDTYTHVKKSFVIRNGVLYRDTLIDNTDLCVLYRDGRMETKKWGTFTMKEIIDADPWQVWGFGPALLDDTGGAVTISHRLQGPNPRAAIGYYEPGHYCFVVVDGRGTSTGVTLTNLSRLMADLGCTAAYNLDGGGSAQMYWNGEIINDGCNEGRTISDIIYLLPEA